LGSFPLVLQNPAGRRAASPALFAISARSAADRAASSGQLSRPHWNAPWWAGQPDPRSRRWANGKLAFGRQTVMWGKLSDA